MILVVGNDSRIISAAVHLLLPTLLVEDWSVILPGKSRPEVRLTSDVSLSVTRTASPSLRSNSGQGVKACCEPGVPSLQDALGLWRRRKTVCRFAQRIPGNQSYDILICVLPTSHSSWWELQPPASFLSVTHTILLLYWISQLPERRSNVSFSKVKSITVIISQCGLIWRTASARKEAEAASDDSAFLPKALGEQKWSGWGGECSNLSRTSVSCSLGDTASWAPAS